MGIENENQQDKENMIERTAVVVTQIKLEMMKGGNE